MDVRFQVSGVGHCVGSRIVSNRDLAVSLGLEPNWFESRTGISHRRICADGEDVLQMAAEAISKACSDAVLSKASLGHETVLLHIQNGLTHLTPPPGIILCKALGFERVRSLSIDGVCSEPINALEIAALMLSKSTCERVIVSASVDFIRMINPADLDTVGLFGAGAGALILETCPQDSPSGLKGLYWENHTKYWDLGIIPMLQHTQGNEEVSIAFGYYLMKGTELARVTLKSISKVIDCVLNQAGWKLKDIDFMITHQPNVKMLEIGIKKLKIPTTKIDLPVVELGNMGPASLLVALSLAKENKRITRQSKVLLVSFGLGFSCSAAALVL